MKNLPTILVLILTVTAAWAEQPQPDGLGEGLINPGFHEKPSWFKDSFLDIREDVEDASVEGRRLLLYFYQDGCPYCAKLLGENFRDRAIVKKTRENFDVVAINMWGDKEVTGLTGQVTTEKAFAASLRVQYTPTLLFLNEAGEVVLRINGYFAPHQFKVALDFASPGQDGRQQDFKAFYAAAHPVAAAGKLHHDQGYLPAPLQLAKNRESSRRPLLVLFEQRQCADCDELHLKSFKNQGLANALTNHDVALLDIWSKESIQTPDGRVMAADAWARSLGIQYVPSLVFFDQSGTEVFRAEAYLKTFHLTAVLDYVATGAYQHQPNFQRFVQHRADRLHAAGMEVDLMR